MDLPILQDVNFSIDQQKLLQEMNEILAQDYKQRKQVLLKRLDVTLHSFLWSVKGEVCQFLANQHLSFFSKIEILLLL